MPRKSAKNLENPTQQIDAALNEPVGKYLSEEAERLGISDIEFKERFAAKLDNDDALDWDVILPEFQPHLEAIEREIEAEKSVRRLESTKALEITQESVPIEPPIIEEEPQQKKRGGRPKKESTALTQTKSTKLKETDAELAEGGQRLKNQANEWQYVNQWLQVALLSAQAHELAGKVQSAEIKASTSWQETLTSYATFQSAELSREMAEFKLEIDKQKLAVSKEDLLVQLQEIQVQHGANVLALLEGVHSLVSQRIVTALKGVDVSSVPEVQFNDVVGSLPPVDFSRTVDIDNFLKSSSNSNQSQSPQN